MKPIYMKKLFYLLPLLLLLACGPSQEEIAKKNEQELAQKTKELNDYKKSKEYQEYKKNHSSTIPYSKEVKELAEERLVSGKNKYYAEKIISPINEYVTLYKMDGCEYIGYQYLSFTNNAYLTHKGNCKFCHKRDSLMMVSIIKSLVPDMIIRHSHR